MTETDSASSASGEPMAIEDTLYARRLVPASADQLTVKPEAEDGGADPSQAVQRSEARGASQPPQASDESVDPWIEGP